MIEVATRDAKGEPLHEALRSIISVPTRRCLWTEADAITFTPELADTVFGDGLALFRITTIHCRPAYWLIRVDSSWQSGADSNAPDDAPEFIEYVDEICFALEDEFGRGRPDDNAVMGRDGRYRDMDTGKFAIGKQPYPAFDDRDGSIWERLDWPKLEGYQFERHPWARTNMPIIAA